MANSEVILALGKNLGLGSSQEDIQNSPDFLSQESRITVDAAGILHGILDGKADILFCGGHTSGKDFMAESVAMKTRLHEQFKDIPHSQVFTDEVSFDTRSNAIEIGSWLAGNPQYTEVDLLSVSFHAMNAAKLLKRFGVPIDQVYKSDQILAGRSEKDKEEIAAWLKTSRIRGEFMKEGLRAASLVLDRRGLLLNSVARYSRT